MQGYSGQSYLCPYYSCTSPYCLAIRPSTTTIPTTNKTTSTSTSTSTGSSFSISSILSRDENTTKEESNELSLPTTTEPTMYQAFTLDRYHPYHHRSLGAVSAFTRTTGCTALQKGDKQSLTIDAFVAICWQSRTAF